MDYQHCDVSCFGRKLAHQFKSLLAERARHQGDAGGVPTRTIETEDQPRRDQVQPRTRSEWMWSQPCCVRGRWSRSNDDIDRPSYQLGRLRRQTVILAISKAILDYDVAALNKSSFFSPRRNAATRCAVWVCDTALRNPTTGVSCCARAVSGQATAPPPITLMKSRRLMLPPRLRTRHGSS